MSETKAITDPHLNAQYQQIQRGRPYGRSGINFLPDITPYFLSVIASGQVNLANPVRILDYGCGRSATLDAFGHILLENLPVLQAMQQKNTPLVAMFAAVKPALNYWLENTAPVPAIDDGHIRLVKFDPSIPEIAQLPRGKFDFVICTDVLEHIPMYSTANRSLVLNNTINKITGYAPHIYLNISTRRATQILPDGQNAHCTLQSPSEWQQHLQLLAPKTTQIHPVLSRDTTSCAFFYGPMSPDLHAMQYTLLETFGPIDLIPYPAPAGMPPEKIPQLAAIQPHKHAVQSRYLSYWLQTDPGCWQNRAFRQLAATLMRQKPPHPAPKPA